MVNCGCKTWVYQGRDSAWVCSRWACQTSLKDIDLLVRSADLVPVFSFGENDVCIFERRVTSFFLALTLLIST